MITKESWQAGTVVYVVDQETEERLGYIPEHVYDRVIDQLQTKLKSHVALLDQAWELLGDYMDDEHVAENAFRLLDEARTRGL